MSAPDAAATEALDRNVDCVVLKKPADHAVGRFWINNWKSIAGWIVALVFAAFTVGSLWTALDNRVTTNEKAISKIEPVLEDLGKVVTRLEVLIEKLEPKGTK